MTSLSIHGRRWFHRGPGNTYFSAYALIDGKGAAGINYEYGYGNQYEWSMFRLLETSGLLPVPVEHYKNGCSESSWRYCERNVITYTSDVVDVQRKKDL